MKIEEKLKELIKSPENLEEIMYFIDLYAEEVFYLARDKQHYCGDWEYFYNGYEDCKGDIEL